MADSTRAYNSELAQLRDANESLYREIRELRAVTEQGFSQLGADIGDIGQTQDDTQRRLESIAAWGDLKFDIGLCVSCLGIIALSQIYVSVARNAPGWLQTYLPTRGQTEQPATTEQGYQGEPSSKQVLAFSDSGELLKKGAAVGKFEVTSSVGWRYVFGAKDWHEGYDLNTPVGTPLHAVLPVDVQCNRSGGGGLQAFYKVGSETHWWVHLSECNPGSYSTGEVFAETGNSGGRTTGAHLDYRVKDDLAGWVRPYKNVLLLTLDPNADIGYSNAGLGPATDNAATVALIKQFEGFHPTPYWDYAQWSYGYGTRAPGPDARINEVDAERQLIAYLERNCYPHIRPLGLPAHKVSALASTCYNLGTAQFTGSDTFKYAKAGDHQAAADALLNWTKAGGEVLPGLVKRREKERAVYLGQ